MERTVRCGRRGTGCACGSRGRANGLIDEFQLAHLNHDVVLAYAKEAANANHDEKQNFADGAEVLVLIVVDTKALISDGFRAYAAIGYSTTTCLKLRHTGHSNLRFS